MITSDFDFMQASYSLQFEQKDGFLGLAHLTESRLFVLTIIARVLPRV